MYTCAVVENILLKSGKHNKFEDAPKPTFNFTNNQTKISFAKAKVIVSLVLAIVYFIFTAINDAAKVKAGIPLD